MKDFLSLIVFLICICSAGASYQEVAPVTNVALGLMAALGTAATAFVACLIVGNICIAVGMLFKRIVRWVNEG